MRRIVIAVLLSCVLSLNFFFYSEELLGYSASLVKKNAIDQTDLSGLYKLGYYRRDYADENLNCRNAVLKFQSSNNLVADGIPGKQFKEALGKKLQQGNTGFNDYVKKPASSQLWIAVNKSKRTLTVYWNKTAINKYPVALGRTNFVTPEGKFKIKNMVINPRWSGGGYAKPVNGGDKNNPLGYRWMGLSIGDQNKYGIHGNNNPYSIGRNVSRGCIRMLNTDVEELYRYVKKGTPVWIGSDQALRKWGVYQNSIVN